MEEEGGGQEGGKGPGLLDQLLQVGSLAVLVGLSPPPFRAQPRLDIVL